VSAKLVLAVAWPTTTDVPKSVSEPTNFLKYFYVSDFQLNRSLFWQGFFC
jgi:hypothetical protein